MDDVDTVVLKASAQTTRRLWSKFVCGGASLVLKIKLSSVLRLFARTPDGVKTGSLAAQLGADVAELRKFVEAAGELEVEWHQLFETMPQIVWITDPNGAAIDFNYKWMEFTGLTFEESLGSGWHAPFHPQDRRQAQRQWEQVAASGELYEIECRLQSKDGTYHWMLGRAAPLRDEQDRIVKWVGTCTDIDELKHAQAQLAQQAQLLDLSPDAIVVHDLERRILYWNQGATGIYGWSAKEAIGRRVDELVTSDSEQVKTALGVLLRDGEWSGELGGSDRTGRLLILACRWTLLHDYDGKPHAVLGVNTDVTERRQVEARLIDVLHHKSTHDPLTRLANRELLALRLDDALEQMGCGDRGVVMFSCDLDDFKIVNDALGHAAGDQVLRQVAQRLQACVRDSDVVARLGGDEFIIVLEDVDEAHVDALEERLFAAVNKPVVLDSGQPIEVSLSIGIARATMDHDAQALLRDADAALYHAKHSGKHRAEHFSEKIHIDVGERFALPQQLRATLDHGGDELFCLYQPEVDLANGRLFGFESLVRWQHPERGLLAPDRFVPLAETTGLTGRLFDYVLGRTLAEQRNWKTLSGTSPTVSVNLSARDLGDATLAGRVANALQRTGVAADLLWLEVTETASTDPASLLTLQALHRLGVRLAIDDFGTGWSSMNRLAELPFDMLKIDRSFTSKLLPGNKTHHMVHATIVMAHALGMRTVAEGIETNQQRELLVEMGCDIGQGYYFARPMPASEATSALTWGDA